MCVLHLLFAVGGKVAVRHDPVAEHRTVRDLDFDRNLHAVRRLRPNANNNAPLPSEPRPNNVASAECVPPPVKGMQFGGPVQTVVVVIFVVVVLAGCVVDVVAGAVVVVVCGTVVVVVVCGAVVVVVQIGALGCLSHQCGPLANDGDANESVIAKTTPMSTANLRT